MSEAAFSVWELEEVPLEEIPCFGISPGDV